MPTQFYIICTPCTMLTTSSSYHLLNYHQRLLIRGGNTRIMNAQLLHGRALFCSIIILVTLCSIIQPSHAWGPMIIIMAPTDRGRRSSSNSALSPIHTTRATTSCRTSMTSMMMMQPSWNARPSRFQAATNTRPKPPARLFARRRDNDEENDNDTTNDTNNPVSPLLHETSKSLRRVSFLSWWGQVILTTVSAVILVFSRNVLSKRDAALSVNDPSFFLSGSGLILSAISILWTWGNGARLSRRLIRRDKPMHRYQAANMLRRAIQVGVTLNLAGLLVHLLAAEEIVGSLAIQVLTTRGAWEVGGMAYPGAVGGGSYLQPLDVLIVQANTNALLSHFCSLVSLLFLTKKVKKLDPPSYTEEGSTVRQ